MLTANVMEVIQDGYGEDGVRAGVRFYTRYKSVMQRWPSAEGKGPEFTMPTHD
jgi:malonate-semialdehyde dehydrogenase (acetylating)/methylmalonate-semialdehyde dehydrogenase